MSVTTQRPAPPSTSGDGGQKAHADLAPLLERLDELTTSCIELRRELRSVEAERDVLAARCGTLEPTGPGGGRPAPPRRSKKQLATGRAVVRAPLLATRVAVRGLTVAARPIASSAPRVGRTMPRVLGRLFLEVDAAGRRALAAIRHGQPPAHGAGVDAPGLTSGRRPRVLIVMPYPIYPPNHGGGVRLYNLVRRLSAACDIHLLVYSQEGEDAGQRQALSEHVTRLDFHHWKPRHRPDRWGLTPPNAQLFDSELARTKLRDIVLDHGIDVVQLEYTELGQLASAVPDGVPVILTEHDIAFRQHQRRHALKFGDRFPESKNFGATRGDLLRLLRYELRGCAAADQVHTMSEEDGRFLSRFLPSLPERAWVVPNGVDTEHYADGGGPRRDVLYVGNYQNLPNVDALEYFVEDIWPLVRLRCPGVGLSVVGANADDRVRRWHGRNGVTVVGPVPDLRDAYHRHRVMVAPIRAGSGTRLKILEAFAAGIPVVSTALGAEGIAYEDDVHCLIRDQPAAFADAVARMLEDDALCDRIAAAARALAVERYDWRPVTATLVRSYHALLAERGEPPDRDRRTAPFGVADGAGGPRSADVSVVIPTLNGGSDLARCLAAIRSQRTGRDVEIVCVDSGSAPGDLETMRRHGAIVHPIEKRHFNHGLTRDLGARLASAPLLVFLNQDAVPVDDDWLERLLEPLIADRDGRIAAVQGGIREVEDRLARFYWDSCGERFYFTRESHRWLGRYGGLGFSTVHCAIRRSVWERYPFGWAPTMEDKKWQREVAGAGLEIVARHDVCVEHTHNYDLRGLLRRCASEGYGWHLLGEPYTFRDMLADMRSPSMWRDRAAGLRYGGIRTGSEKWFPLLRPAAVWWGNRVSRKMR